MKKLLLIFVLLISLCLSSCSLAQIEDTNGEEDFNLSTLSKEDVFTYNGCVRFGSVEKSYDDSFSFSCKKLSGNYLVKTITPNNRHIIMTINNRVTSGNAYLVLIRDGEVYQELGINSYNIITIEGGSSEIEFRVLAESCEIKIDVSFVIKE